VLKKVLIGLALFVVAVIGAIALFVFYQDRKTDPTPLVERLAATPIPADLVLIEEYSIQGSWLIKPRSAEASRKYVAGGPVSEVCARLDRFYAAEGLAFNTLFRSDDPADWCGRSIDVEGGDVQVDVEPINSWTEPPEALVGRPDLVEVRYSAYRD
jgi:hypothetical protein